MKIDKEFLKEEGDRLLKSPIFIEDCERMVKSMLAICAISGASMDDVFNKTVITMQAIINNMDSSGRSEELLSSIKERRDLINKVLGIEFE